MALRRTTSNLGSKCSSKCRLPVSGYGNLFASFVLLQSGQNPGHPGQLSLIHRPAPLEPRKKKYGGLWELLNKGRRSVEIIRVR